MYNQYSPTSEQNFWAQKQAKLRELNKGIDTHEGMYNLGEDGEIRYKKYSAREKRKFDLFRERIFNPTPPPSQTKGNRYKKAQQEALAQAAQMTAARHQEFMNTPINPDNLTPYGRQIYNQ